MKEVNFFDKINKNKNILKYMIWILILIVVICDFFSVDIFKFFALIGLEEKSVIVIFLLLILSLLLEIDLYPIDMKLNKTNLKFYDLTLLASGNSVFLEPHKHPYIWEDFVGNYYAVNAPWLLEENSNEEYEKMIEKHKLRYLDERMVKTYYIFFTETKYKGSIQRFYNFISRLYSEIPQIIDKKVRIVIIDDKAPEYTFFIGEKPKNVIIENKYKSLDSNDYLDYSILYLSDAPFITGEGMPNWSIVTINSPLNKTLLEQAREYVFSDKLTYIKLENKELKISEFIENFDKIKRKIEEKIK
jgi:hypothetical protein